MKVDAIDIISLYCDIYNLTEGLTKRGLLNIIKQQDPADILEVKKQILLQKLVRILDTGLDKETGLRIKPSPFKADLREITKHLEVTDE